MTNYGSPIRDWANPMDSWQWAATFHQHACYWHIDTASFLGFRFIARAHPIGIVRCVVL